MTSFVEDIDEDVGAALRLKESLSLRKISSAEGFCFEVDIESDGERIDKFDLETLKRESGEEFYMKDYIKDPELKHQLLLDSLNLDEKMGEFEESLPGMQDLIPDGKIKKLVIRKSEKEVVSTDAKISYHYIAYAQGKREPVDSSIARGQVCRLNFSDGNTYEGLFIALQSMGVGEISKFWIHYEFAYGVLGVPPRIPPRGNILCVVEMLSVIGKQEIQNVAHMSREELAHLPFERIMESVENLKDEGNKFFGKKNLNSAISKYRKGIYILTNYSALTLVNHGIHSRLLGTLYANIAQAYLENKEARKACVAARNGIQLEGHPLKHKLFIRFAKAKAMLQEFEDAIRLAQKAIAALQPDMKAEGKDYDNFLEEVKRCKEAEAEDLRKLYSKMMSGKNNVEGEGV